MYVMAHLGGAYNLIATDFQLRNCTPSTLMNTCSVQNVFGLLKSSVILESLRLVLNLDQPRYVEY